MRVRRRRLLLPVAAAATLAAGCSASRPSADRADVPAAPAVTAAADSSPSSLRVAPPDGPSTPTRSEPQDGSAVSAGTTTSAGVPSSPPAFAPAPTLGPITAEEWARVDAHLTDRLLGGGDFAFALAVSIDGVPAHAAAYGARNHPNMVPPPPETSLPTMLPTTTVSPLALEPVEVTDRFRIASISKILTGTVTLQLVDAGDLSLDEPVAPRLAEHLGIGLTGQAVETVTVRQLLSHTSGFGPFERTFFGHGVESCREAAIRGFAVGLDSTPGTTYRYSNMNFCVLGQLIEAVTGEPYEDAVRELLLEPLGIGGMRMAGTFDVRPDEVVHPSFPGRNYMETLGGAGAWVATPAEIVRVVDSLDNAKPGWHPLPGELASMMRRPVPGITYHDPLWQWYGLATIAYADQSWGHTGTVENTHAVVRHRPDGMTWALFVSGNHPEDSDDLARMFQEALDQSGIDAPAPTTSTTTTTSTTSTSSTSTTVPAGVVGPIAVEPLGTLPD